MVGTLSGEVVIEAVKAFVLGAVKVEPPVADEVVLVKHGAIGAEEDVLGDRCPFCPCIRCIALHYQPTNAKLVTYMLIVSLGCL